MDGFEDEFARLIPGSEIAAALNRAVDQFASKIFFSRVPLLLLLTITVVTVLFYVAVISSHLVQSRSGDTAMLRSRGMAPLGMARLSVYEALAMSATAVTARTIRGYGSCCAGRTAALPAGRYRRVAAPGANQSCRSVSSPSNRSSGTGGHRTPQRTGVARGTAGPQAPVRPPPRCALLPEILRGCGPRDLRRGRLLGASVSGAPDFGRAARRVWCQRDPDARARALPACGRPGVHEVLPPCRELPGRGVPRPGPLGGRAGSIERRRDCPRYRGPGRPPRVGNNPGSHHLRGVHVLGYHPRSKGQIRGRRAVGPGRARLRLHIVRAP